GRRPDVVADGEQLAGLHVVLLVRAAGRPALLLGRRERGEALRLVRQALRRARHAGAALEARRVRLLERARALGRRRLVAVVRVPCVPDARAGRWAERMRRQRGRGGRGGCRRRGLGGGRGHLREHRAPEEPGAGQESHGYDLSSKPDSVSLGRLILSVVGRASRDVMGIPGPGPQNFIMASSWRRVMVGLFMKFEVPWLATNGRSMKFVKNARALTVSGFSSWESMPTTGPFPFVPPKPMSLHEKAEMTASCCRYSYSP